MNVEALLHSLRLQLRRIQVNSGQVEPAVATVALANSLWLYSQVQFIHGGQFSVLHQHTESITVAPSSLRKASVEENQSIQRLRCD